MQQRWLIVLAILVAATNVTSAQTTEQDRVAPPKKIGNHYDHKAFQPTPNGVCVGQNKSGVDCDSAAGAKADNSLEQIRKEIDSVDRLYPPSHLPSSKP